MEDTLGLWRTRSVAQGELLGGNFSPFSFKDSPMGPCKGWGGFSSAHTCLGNMGPYVSLAQDQCHGRFLG